MRLKLALGRLLSVAVFPATYAFDVIRVQAGMHWTPACAGVTEAVGCAGETMHFVPTQSTTPPPSSAPTTASAPARRGVAGLRADAIAVAPLLTTPLAREFVAQAATLPNVAPRSLRRSADRRNWLTPAGLAALPEADRSGWTTFEADEEFYYTTRYGSSIAYARALEVLGRRGVETLRGARVLDFGCGAIGHLRLMAACGADVVGVDVEPLLPVLYDQPTDTGAIRGTQHSGRLSIATGRWPAEAPTRTSVGGGYDLILSKNTLKNGYINPAEKVDPRMLVDLGVSAPEYVAAMFQALKPGGRVLIYNFCPAPAPAGKPYIPWADGRCPFPREMLEKAGFRVVAFDEVDDGAAREFARALGWDQRGMNLESDLFAWYTLLERPSGK